ncbi:hypothetical protein AB0J87_60365, partial [Nonomuraea sp. NPDC049625]
TRLASGSDDGTVRLWDARTGRPIGNPLTGHTDSVEVVVFSPDSTRLYSADLSGRVHVWNIQLPSDLLSAVCAIAVRGLTQEEWQQYVPDAPYKPTCPMRP